MFSTVDELHELRFRFNDNFNGDSEKDNSVLDKSLTGIRRKYTNSLERVNDCDTCYFYSFVQRKYALNSRLKVRLFQRTIRLKMTGKNLFCI